jgi:hypothetical protein
MRSRVLTIPVIRSVIFTYSISASVRFVVSLRLTPFFLMAHGHGIFAILTQLSQIISPTPTGNNWLYEKDLFLGVFPF